MSATTNIVNLDALIKRADLAAPGEQGEDISSLSVLGLEPKGMLFPALRKPDFQRETANWTPEQVADLIITFARRDLIPAVILWRAGQDVFVIDGAHRLSALVAWVHDDYGDREISQRHFQNLIPDDQKRAAFRTRELVNMAIGSFQDHKIAIDHPLNARKDVAERAARIAWQEIPAQWIRNADHDKAEKAFFRINQGGTKIDSTERRILAARHSATAFAARSILRAGTGHNYWKKFSAETAKNIEALGGEIYDLLFKPVIQLPIKTLDVPLAGHGYGPRTLPFVFDLVNIINKVQVKDSSYKKLETGDNLGIDEDGSQTIKYLLTVKSMLLRICSTDPSSLGIHPGLYFYTKGGTFQSASLLSYVALFLDWTTDDFRKFSKVRSRFEEFILNNKGVTEAISKLGSGARSRPRVTSLYRKIIEYLNEDKSQKEIAEELSKDSDFDFFVAHQTVTDLFSSIESAFSRDVKGAAYLRDALPSAPRCPSCGGAMHRNGMQIGHKNARRDGGTGELANAMMQHPFCNSTMAN
ncbi:DUF262 domain-containing protein [Phyllobacterium sp. NPDC097923]|uniref:DUF262 domain-containing protein n=1 Tax=Phyllobacterium sp. NPDC097923 TaxID=3364404 RepID=UPI00383A98A8